MRIISKNIRELRGEIVYLRTNCNSRDYPTEFQTYSEAWESLDQSIRCLNAELGDQRYSMLIKMMVKAKGHYDDGYAINDRSIEVMPGFDHIKLGSRLLQDMEQVVNGKEPFAYPKELYEWS